MPWMRRCWIMVLGLPVIYYSEVNHPVRHQYIIKQPIHKGGISIQQQWPMTPKKKERWYQFYFTVALRSFNKTKQKSHNLGTLIVSTTQSEPLQRVPMEKHLSFDCIKTSFNLPACSEGSDSKTVRTKGTRSVASPDGLEERVESSKESPEGTSKMSCTMRNRSKMEDMFQKSTVGKQTATAHLTCHISWDRKHCP
jgi:hypothetical protein